MNVARQELPGIGAKRCPSRRYGVSSGEIERFSKKFRKTDCEKLATCTRSWARTREQFSAVWRTASLKGVPIDMLPGSLAPLKVVVVDDDPMIRMVVGRCLTYFGATTTLCENAISGIQAVEQIRPRVVLADLIMPERDGFYLLQQIKAFEDTHNWRTGIVVITGVRDPELEQELERAGVTYLPKPFTPRDLFDAVRQAMQPFSLPEKGLESLSNAV
jgi:CheY-like chemotaxis protein